MQQQFNYGPRLSDEEYESRVFELHRGLPPMPTQGQDTMVRRLEMDLAIDHRLGRDFPLERRAALWEVQQQIDKKRIRLAFRYLLRWLFPKYLAHGAQTLAKYAVNEYAKVLSESELRSFFDLHIDERPTLPVDVDQFKK
jgi:hypothetical protein